MNDEEGSDPELLEPLGAEELPSDPDPVRLYLNSLRSERSRERMQIALRRAAQLLSGATNLETAPPPEHVPWSKMRRPHLERVRRELAREYAPSTANLVLSAVRGVLRAAHQQGHVPPEHYVALLDVPSVRAQLTESNGRVLSSNELDALFDSCREDAEDNLPEGARDAALLSVLYAGLRRAEAAELEAEDALVQPGAVRVREGQGGVNRWIYLPEGGQQAMNDWLTLRGHQPGPLWSRVRRGSNLVLPATGLTPAGINDVCRRRAERAGVDTFGPHDLRQTFISDLFEAGVDTKTVQRLAGHATPATTGRYDDARQVAREQVRARLRVSYRCSEL